MAGHTQVSVWMEPDNGVDSEHVPSEDGEGYGVLKIDRPRLTIFFHDVDEVRRVIEELKRLRRSWNEHENKD